MHLYLKSHLHNKIDSEHHLFGKQYPGEFRIAHYHDTDRGRLIIISILMDDSSDEENKLLEQFLREWEETFWKRNNECQAKKSPYVTPYSRTYGHVSREEMKATWGEDKDWRSDFNLYGFLTTPWYCGYKGSLTVPPCSERVDWRVLDVPMKMSHQQYERIKKILLEQLDTNCAPSSIGYNSNFNRPIQKYKGDIWCCSEEDWTVKNNNIEFWKDRMPEN